MVIREMDHGQIRMEDCRVDIKYQDDIGIWCVKAGVGLSIV